MTTDPKTIISEMLKDAPDQEAALDNNIDQIQAQIDALNDKDNAMVQEMCNPNAADLEAYLNNEKIQELETLYDSTSYLVVEIYGNYNTINYETGGITDWAIIDTTADATANIVYEYLGIGWDDDTGITTWITDFAFANDYLTRPISQDATYGIRPMVLQLETAKSLLENNKSKITQSKDVLSRYTE